MRGFDVRADGRLGDLLELADLLFHFLAGLERDDVLGRDIHLLAGARVAGLARLAALDLEDAEVAQLDTPVAEQRLDDGVEGFLDDFLGFQLRQAKLFGNLFDDLFFGHLLGLRAEPVWVGGPIRCFNCKERME